MNITPMELAVWWVFGGVVVTAIVAWINKSGISIADVVCSLVLGIAWPLLFVSAFIVWLMVSEDNWLTKRRFFARRR